MRENKGRAKFLDPGARIVGEFIDDAHPEWGMRNVILAGDGRRLASSQHAATAWKHACRKLEQEKCQRESQSPPPDGSAASITSGKS